MPFITMKEAGELLGVSHSTLIRWTTSGKLKYTRTLGGHRRISKGDLERIVKQNLRETNNQEVEGGSGLDLSALLERTPADLGRGVDDEDWLAESLEDELDPLGLNDL